MRFILLEETEESTLGAAPKFEITDEVIEQYRKGDNNTREKILHQVLNMEGMRRAREATNAFRTACNMWGLDEEINPFIKFIPSILDDNVIKNDPDGYLTQLVHLTDQGVVPKERLELTYLA